MLPFSVFLRGKRPYYYVAFKNEETGCITGKEAGGFTSEERELVGNYRSLSGDDKLHVQALIDSMLSAQGAGKKDALAAARRRAIR